MARAAAGGTPRTMASVKVGPTAPYMASWADDRGPLDGIGELASSSAGGGADLPEDVGRDLAQALRLRKKSMRERSLVRSIRSASLPPQAGQGREHDNDATNEEDGDGGSPRLRSSQNLDG